jgi:hypothetical protein
MLPFFDLSQCSSVSGMRLLPSASGKEGINISPHFAEPGLPLALGARNDNAEHAAVKDGNPAKTEDAVLPDCLQGVAEDIPFP